jgi:hypothetical protein
LTLVRTEPLMNKSEFKIPNLPPKTREGWGTRFPGTTPVR